MKTGHFNLLTTVGSARNLRLFLLEEAAKGINWIRRSRARVRLRVGTSSRVAAHATELRFQQAGSDSTDVRDKFRVSSCTFNQKRNGGAFAVALATADRAKNSSDA